MPDLYVDSATGADSAGSGTTASSPLRSLTFAVAEAVRVYGAGRTTIHLAAGTYSRGTGEVFPIEMPQNLSVAGAGRDTTTILFESVATAGYELALGGAEELSGFTLVGMPLGPLGCYVSVGIHLPLGTSYVHDVAVDIGAGAPADEYAFGTGILAENTARIENVRVSRCYRGISYLGGDATVTAATLLNNQTGLGAFGPGTVSGCTFDGNHAGVDTHAGVATTVEGCHFDRCVLGITIHGGDPMARTPVVRRNVIDVVGYGVSCTAGGLIEDNDIRAGVPGVPVVCGFSETRYDGVPVAQPLFRNNRVSRGGPYDPSRLGQSLVQLTQAVVPVFEGNRFFADPGVGLATLEILHDANPDLGGGAGGSAGGNRFEVGWVVFHQDDRSPSKTVFARNNAWAHVPPLRGFHIWVPRDYYVDPESRRDTVTLITEGGVAI